ncbi:putative Tyrosine--tRNA ligase [Rhodotorula taiwanensis]|uniref:Tyrosine--tRNA ligase n=1 Tax=Rhodotorula taiwanensis TaxID=741276 RepID=A0A2S5B2U2_9BASI|nr:putative Tyrosine--tRNA ligase [Rhodotorula taiwanensis]
MLATRREVLRSLLSSYKASPAGRHAVRTFASTRATRNVVRELEQRGMLSELTSRSAREHVEKPITVYLGVDPSARSLHVGNLLALIGLLHFRLYGHNAVALIGGATGAIGDPSGRSTERNALAPETLSANVESISAQLTAFLDRGVAFAKSRNRRRDGAQEGQATSEGSVRVVNNLDWTGGLSLLEFLSTVGKMARVSTMLSRESVKSRLDSSSGISFTEFSYQLLQAYDFLRLHRDLGCTMQLGGSDQLGNIVSGIDLIRRSNHVAEAAAKGVAAEAEEGAAKKEDPAFGLTFPLLTTATGEKFGKSAGNAIWLDARMTSPFDVYQFFLRTTDEEVEKYLRIFTFIRIVELEGIMQDHKVNPKARIAQKILAAEATELIHGAEGLNQALAATSVFYGTDLADLVTPEIVSALDGSPSSSSSSPAVPSMLTRLPRADVLGQHLEKAVLASGLLASKTQARKAIEAGTVQVNGQKVSPKSHQRMISEADLLDGRLLVLKTGKSAHKAILLE